MTDFDAALERAQADGRISTGDADEVRRFADFLTEVGPCKTTAEKGQIWRKHYPEDYALAVAERDARLARHGDGGEGNGE